MNVLVTGAYGTCGTAIIDHLDAPGIDLSFFNRSDRPADHPYGGYETIVGDVTDAAAIDEAAAGMDAIVHLAACPDPGATWGEVLLPNVVGMYNVLEAARSNACDSVVFGSSNHVVGMYEEEHAPELYEPGYDLLIDHADPVRPDSYYGATKSFGEDLGRYYVEGFEHPRSFYALRIGSVRDPPYDHPYGDAERKVERGETERGSPAYERTVARMKCTWQSRRDFAHQVACCLGDESVAFDVFYGVSDNANRWLDIEHARDRIGYDPQDDGAAWDAPPGDA